MLATVLRHINSMCLRKSEPFIYSAYSKHVLYSSLSLML